MNWSILWNWLPRWFQQREQKHISLVLRALGTYEWQSVSRISNRIGNVLSDAAIIRILDAQCEQGRVERNRLRSIAQPDLVVRDVFRLKDIP